MAREPAVHVGLALPMAGNAEFHIKIAPFDTVHCLDGAVTFPAFYVFFDMTLMIEQNVLGQIIHLSPRYRYLIVKISVLLLNLGVIGDNIVVAV